MTNQRKTKNSFNTTLYRDVAEFFRENLKGDASRIVNNLSRSFKRAMERNESVMEDALFGNFTILFDSEQKDHPEKE